MHIKAGGLTADAPRFSKPVLRTFLPLSDDHPCFALVGLIAAEAARIEFLIDQAIAQAANLDGTIAACLTGQMIGPGPRFTALLQLCRQRGVSADLIKRIGTLSGHAHCLFGRRNRAVHDPWLEASDSREPHQFRGKAKLNPKYGVVPAPQAALADDLSSLRTLRAEVTQLFDDLRHALRSV